MATIDIASNSALLELVDKLAEQNNILSGSTVTLKGETGETGNGISSIEKTKSEGLVDTYTITYTNGTTTTFNVTNGEKGDKGDKGEAGNDGTSVTITGITENTEAERTNIVTFSNGQTLAIKNGKNGTDGKDGVSVVHEWNGTTLKVTSASGTTSADLKGDTGSTGATGKSAYDYAKDGGYTGTEEEFAKRFAFIMGYSVFGYVDENMDVILEGDINNGAYLKVVMEDGSLLTVGQFVPKSTYNNLAGTISVGRLGSDGTIRNDSSACRVTDFVPVKNGDIIRVKGICFTADTDLTSLTFPSAVYNSAKTKLSSIALANGDTEYYTVQETTGDGAMITIISDYVAYVRFSGYPTVADEDIIVTVNQEIE
jgi:hypothetical protein